MGEWMHADFQYDYFNDRSFFQDKSYRAVEGWKCLGRAARDDPLNMVVPGVMEAWQNPKSPAAWGKAAVDIGLLATSFCKGAHIAASAGKYGEFTRTAGRIGLLGDEFAIVERLSSITNGCKTFFEGAQYSSKVLRQMSKVDDIYRAFPTSVDGFATKFGTWTTKVGSDGKTYQWLEMRGSYKRYQETGISIHQRSNGIVNH